MSELEMNIHEVLISMIFEEFLMKYPKKELELQELLVDFHSKDFSGEVWNGGKERAKPLEEMFQAHLAKMASQSQSFSFWNTYVSDLYPIARDVTNSMRSGDWHLFLSVVERARSLFFFFFAEQTTADGHQFFFRIATNWKPSSCFCTSLMLTVDL